MLGVGAGVALVGILIISAALLWTLQRVFTGDLRGKARDFTDVRRHEAAAIALLLVASLGIGLAPRPLLSVITACSLALRKCRPLRG